MPRTASVSQTPPSLLPSAAATPLTEAETARLREGIAVMLGCGPDTLTALPKVSMARVFRAEHSRHGPVHVRCHPDAAMCVPILRRLCADIGTLAGGNADAPVVAPIGGPVETAGHAVTVWPTVDCSDAARQCVRENFAAAAGVLTGLRSAAADRGLPNRNQPDWLTVTRGRLAALEERSDLSDCHAQWSGRFETARQAFESAAATLSRAAARPVRGLLHGDPHLDNWAACPSSGRLLLIDLDTLSVGAAEIDLAALLFNDVCYQRNSAAAEQILAGTTASSSGLAAALRLREAWMTACSLHWIGTPGETVAAAEADRRLERITGPLTLEPPSSPWTEYRQFPECADW